MLRKCWRNFLLNNNKWTFNFFPTLLDITFGSVLGFILILVLRLVKHLSFHSVGDLLKKPVTSVFSNANSIPNNLPDDRVNSCNGSRQSQQVLCFTHYVLYIQPLIQQTMKLFDKTLRHAASRYDFRQVIDEFNSTLILSKINTITERGIHKLFLQYFGH